jgi:hypothetical protein
MLPEVSGFAETKQILLAEDGGKWKDRYEALGDLTRADFFLEVTNFTNDVFIQSAMWEHARNVLGEEKEHQVIAAVVTANFNDFDAMEQTDAYKTALQVAHAKEQFKRNIIVDFLDTNHTLGLKEEERIIVRGYMSMATVMDEISLAWRDEVVWSETGRKISALSEEQKVAFPTTLSSLGLDHKYAFLRPGENADFDKLIAGAADHGYYEVSQMATQRHLYERLGGLMDGIISQLGNAKESPEMRDRYVDYFHVWSQMVRSRDVDETEKLSEELDRMWMLLPDELLVTHPMEYGYYGEDTIRKDMMGRLDLMDTSKKDLVDACNKQKEEIYAYMLKHADPEEHRLLLSKLDSLKQTRFVVLAPITQTMGYDFKAAGESLPNSDHQRVTDALGKRILVFLDGSANSWGRRSDVWQYAFDGTSFSEDLVDLVTQDWMIYLLASHETGETISRDADTDTRLGFKLSTDMNEIKSDVSGLARYGELAEKNELSDEQMNKLAKLEIASLLFYLSRWGVPQVDPYHKGGIITANIAIESGLLTEKDGRWIPDYSKSRDFLMAIRDFFWERQAPIWESEDAFRANWQKTKLVDWYLEVHPGVDALMRLVSNRYREFQEQ